MGGVLGLAIAFGVWRANQAFTPTPQYQTQTSPPSTPQTLSLIVTSPEDEAVADKEKIIVSGKTQAGANVIIATEKDEAVTTADAQGNFSAEIALVEGGNDIVITAIMDDGESVEKRITVVFSTEV